MVEGIAKKFGDEKFIVSQILNPLQEVCDFMGPMVSIKLFVKTQICLNSLWIEQLTQLLKKSKPLPMRARRMGLGLGVKF